MEQPHLAAQRVTITPENWSGALVVRVALDGRVSNAGVLRYRSFAAHHLRNVEAFTTDAETICLETETIQSRLRIVMAARTSFHRGADALDGDRLAIMEPSYIAQQFAIDVTSGVGVAVEKVIALQTSRDRAIADPRSAALMAVARAASFRDLLESHALAWAHIWRRCDLGLIRVEGEQGHAVQKIIRLNIYHVLQTASPHTVDLDTGIPARGWHGEGYRGHIFWDELFVLPLLNVRLPDVARALLLYRYRRMPEAREAARQAGYRGAMFPWQSGSDGREETDPSYLNPRSGHFIRDNTHLERHVGAAIAFNVWHYYEATGDADFLHDVGAKMMLEIARFWASIAVWSEKRGRYEIHGVIGPDEFHDAYPGAAEPGVNNNAYTNIMAVWCIERALNLFTILPAHHCDQLCDSYHLDKAELEHWDAVSRKMFVPFQDDGIISQFEGYEKLEELDWEAYRRTYGDIMRLDLILEAEKKTPNGFKLCKQADVLMLFYLFSTETMTALFERLGYPFEGAFIPKNIDYYLQRTSHGSTLSAVVDAWVLARSDRVHSWCHFKRALRCDVDDTGGMTAEGVHLGAMAGSVDLLQRCYSGLELRDGELWFNPALPAELLRLRFRLRYRRHSLEVDIADGALTVESEQAAADPITIRLGTQSFTILPGGSARFSFDPAPA
jgi:trehalose/maltose hydrolase-like predicted phosphorylase